MANDTRPYQQDASMSEKHEQVRNDQRVRKEDLASYYLKFAEAEASQGSDGRWAKTNKVEVVTGRYDGFNRHPKLPATSPWSCENAALLQPEPKLGYDVNEVPVIDDQQTGDGPVPLSPEAGAGVEPSSPPAPPVPAPTPSPTLRKRGL
jgi:hypothetical protein